MMMSSYTNVSNIWFVLLLLLLSSSDYYCSSWTLITSTTRTTKLVIPSTSRRNDDVVVSSSNTQQSKINRSQQQQRRQPLNVLLMSTKIPITETEEEVSSSSKIMNEIDDQKTNNNNNNNIDYCSDDDNDFLLLNHGRKNNNLEEFTSSTTSKISPLSYTLDELGSIIGGTGRAKSCWECYRIGIDPVWFWNNHQDNDDDEKENIGTIVQLDDDDTKKDNNNTSLLVGWTRQQIKDSNLVGLTNGLGKQSIGLIQNNFVVGKQSSSSSSSNNIENSIADLVKITISPDGTTKLLLKLLLPSSQSQSSSSSSSKNSNNEHLEIETVIIPWHDRKKSTLCVSSQVGCKQACTFCATGKMGKLRSLTQDEILIQLYWANKVCRILRHTLYEINNVVFMGMGEPADNCEAVVPASQRMMDPNLFQLANRRVTISTVAPTPDSFRQLIGSTSTNTNNDDKTTNMINIERTNAAAAAAAAPTGSSSSSAVLAWSVHSTRDDLRRQLVPTTKYTMEELRRGLIDVLQGRSKRQRNIMLEITLLDDINDNEEDALHLVEFCQPILDEVRGIKLVINLIPWNDIGATFGPASLYRPPKPSKVLAFQKILFDNNLLCYVRTTRGDEENSACGMLATKNKKT